MDVVKDVHVERIYICDNDTDPLRLHDGCCPWGHMYRATLIVNGFPHRRLLRFNPSKLEDAIQDWFAEVGI